MDICSFINSPDIAEHLQNIGYQFNSIEAAWLIFQSRFKTWEEKKAAWKELIETMPDCELPERLNCRYYPSLHDMIRKFMDLLDRKADEFYRADDRTVYRYSFYCKDDWTWCEEYETICLSLDEVWQEIDEDMDLNICNIAIRKEILGKKDYSITLYFDEKKQLMEIEPRGLSDEEWELLGESFEGLWFSFPVPFKKGDIVVERRENLPEIIGGENGAFVLRGCTGITEDAEKQINFAAKNGDNSDMNAWGYFQNEDGTIYGEVMTNYMDLVYYRGPFEGTKRFLLALSNFMKDEISLEILLCAYKKVILDEFADDIMLKSWFTEEGLELAGFGKKRS